MRQLLDVGTRIYNHGDRCNWPHFGRISAVVTDKWATRYQITPDADADREGPYWIPSVIFSAEYQGNGLTRFVTEEAYLAWKQERITEMER